MANDVDTSSELSKIAKLNGDFRRNYGTLIGAVLYLRTVSAARRSPWLWAGLISIALSTVLSWLGRHVGFCQRCLDGAEQCPLFLVKRALASTKRIR